MGITEFIDHLSDHLTRQRTYRMLDADILPLLQELETASRLIAAVSAELAAEAEVRSLHLKRGTGRSGSTAGCRCSSRPRGSTSTASPGATFDSTSASPAEGG